MNTRINLLAIALIVSLSSVASAQTTGSQKYTVTVPTNISITAPVDATITHDESDNDQAFPAQQWTVKGNTLAGVSVTFETDQAFTHTTDNSFKRDAKLDLSINTNSGPATWNISQASDQTDYDNSDEVASVQASSDGVGRATFDLAVSFLTGEYGSFAAGDYETTVTGTVTSN